MLELADEVGPNAGLLIDSFHCYASGTPLDEIARIPATRIVLAHLNDAASSPLHLLKDDQRLLPGEGASDLPGFIGSLKTAGYNGPVSLEVFSARLKKLGPIEAAKAAWNATARTLEGVNLE
jgi:sugar phosphate isomerase/epimerase